MVWKLDCGTGGGGGGGGGVVGDIRRILDAERGLSYKG